MRGHRTWEDTWAGSCGAVPRLDGDAAASYLTGVLRGQMVLPARDRYRRRKLCAPRAPPPGLLQALRSTVSTNGSGRDRRSSQRASASPMGVDGSPATNGHISSAMRRQLAVALRLPSNA
jgi:hypothetical protein